MVSKNPLFFDSDAEAILALEHEGRRLKYIAVKLWRKYLSEYKPSAYARTRKSQKGIVLGKVRKLDAITWGIELTFVDSLMYHDSVVQRKDGNVHPKGHSIMLISEGWRNTRGKNKDVYRFGYFDGIDYIGRVQREFEKSAKIGISLEVLWGGEPFVKGDRDGRKNVLKR